MPRSAAEELANTLGQQLRSAAGTRWLAIATVTSSADLMLTLNLDGADITEVRYLASYLAPGPGDVVLVAVVRGSASVQYVALGKILT